jgi:ubiquinone/menaquinone biosynthesis C-methylase UbiE
MLSAGRRNAARAGHEKRIELLKEDAKATSFAAGSFDAVLSNSIIHHIPEPASVFAEMWRVLAPGGVLFVRDLVRPSDAGELARLVDVHAPAPAALRTDADAMQSRQRALLEASLHAALTLDEVRARVAPLGVASHAVKQTSDRHWTLAATKPR